MTDIVIDAIEMKDEGIGSETGQEIGIEIVEEDTEVQVHRRREIIVEVIGEETIGKEMTESMIRVKNLKIQIS